MASTLFISDLHLSPARPDLISLACEFLSASRQAETIYIMGDIFDTWLGDDLVEPAFEAFNQTLLQLSRDGIQVFLMVGNRDFMLGHDYARQVGATLLPDPTMIELAGKRVLLMHGDSLCTDDESYQRYRRVVRNRFLQWCFLKLPRQKRQNISDRIKAKSAMQKQGKEIGIMDVNSLAVSQTVADFNADVLIHGHTHRPAIHKLGEYCHRIVMGDWHDQPSYLKFADGQFTLEDPRVPAEKAQLSLV